MAQHAQQGTAQKTYRQPKRTDLLFHFFKTGRLVRALLADKRVSVVRKGAYISAVGLLLAALVFPEALADLVTLVTPLFPAIGIEVPADATIDWVAFAVATFSLLKLFPKEIIGEHYDRLFRR